MTKILIGRFMSTHLQSYAQTTTCVCEKREELPKKDIWKISKFPLHDIKSGREKRNIRRKNS